MTDVRQSIREHAFEPLRSLVCGLLALAVLLQSLWLPFHLACERHLAPGESPTQFVTPVDPSLRCEVLREDGGDGPSRRLHLGLEHKSVKDRRVEDDSVAPPDLHEPCFVARFLLVLDAPAERVAAPSSSPSSGRDWIATAAPRAPPVA